MEFDSKLYLPLTDEQIEKIVKTVFGTGRYQAKLIEGGTVQYNV